MVQLQQPLANNGFLKRTRKRPVDLIVKFPINNTHVNFGHYSEGFHTPTMKLSCVSGAYLTRCVHQFEFLSLYSFCVTRLKPQPSWFAQQTRVPAVSLRCSCCKKITDAKKITLAAPCHLAWRKRVTHGGHGIKCNRLYKWLLGIQCGPPWSMAKYLVFLLCHSPA
jgi:hypothetical protein